MSAELVPVGDQLATDAQSIRALQAQGQRTMVEIATLLRSVRDREQWTTRQLAEWCKSERLGFDTHPRVTQILNYGRTVALLGNGSYQAPPAEWTLRPLTQALSAGLPAEKAPEVWAKVIEAADVPTAADVADVVEKLPFVRRLRRSKAKAKRARTKRPIPAYDEDDPSSVFAACQGILRRVFATMDDVVNAEFDWDRLSDDQYNRLIADWDVRSARFRSAIADQRSQA